MAAINPMWAADEIEKFVAEPVNVNDRFDSNSLQRYLTKGDIRWSMLKVSVPTGGMFAYQQLIDAKFVLEFDVWPIEFDAQQQCVSQCRFVCANGWEIVVVLQRVRARRDDRAPSCDCGNTAIGSGE